MEKTEENIAAVNDVACDAKNRSTKKSTGNRPAMQIYKPPGLRSGGTASPPDSQSENGGFPSQNDRGSENGLRAFGTRTEENNNHRKSPPQQRLSRTESSLSSESAVSQKSSGGASLGSADADRLKIANDKPPRNSRPTPPRNITVKEKPKKIMSPKEMQDAALALRALQLATNAAEMEQLIASDFSDESSAECVGSSIAQHAIEAATTGCCKQATKACGLLVDANCFPYLSKGLLNSIAQYFDCRQRLRQEHFRMWIAFLNFVSDLYASVGATPNGDLVSFVFQVFDFLLKPPVLESLKIEELECLIASLLANGYALERDCPDRLSHLKDLIRNAFIDVHEPWARKMILLLLELGASGWKLPPEANDYYFLQSNN